jgi:hypothetical protein
LQEQTSLVHQGSRPATGGECVDEREVSVHDGGALLLLP